jgi:hypothetical protein
MTSRKPGQNPAAPRPAPRPAGMSVVRAITKTLPAGAAPARVSRGRKPRREELPAGPAPLAPSPIRTPRTRGSYNTSSKNDQQRLAELKVKLGDPDYMEGAILRIATVLSARLTLR